MKNVNLFVAIVISFGAVSLGAHADEQLVKTEILLAASERRCKITKKRD